MGVRLSAAQQRYATFVAALDLLTEELACFRRFIVLMTQRRTPAGGWRMASPDELVVLYGKACADLEALKLQAIRYEAELTAREWQV
ncbi:hypothetical protein [Crossiella sp. CA198]|uniref:hypothetical protein n=1 Tax=Crossiella sp. CA198 TaxID=3455607 RepID=UPI003F8D572D